jgi:hypothetical protein
LYSTPITGCASGSSRRSCGCRAAPVFGPREANPGEELNAWLLDRCIAYAKAHKHPELPDCTIWPAFEAERRQLVQITGPFDAFHATQDTVAHRDVAKAFNQCGIVIARLRKNIQIG